MTSKTNRLRFMDAGRGVAALVVLEHHVMVYFGKRISGSLGSDTTVLASLKAVSGLNGVAVAFFFFLSGWAIWLSLDQVRSSDGRLDWAVFAWHRCRRILPLYWLSLLWSWALFVPLNESADVASSTNLLGNLAFLQTPAVTNGWFTPFAANGPLWSLAFEGWYYAATPIVCIPIFWAGASENVRYLLLMFSSLTVAIIAVAFTRLLFFPLAVYSVMWPVWIAGFTFGASRGDASRVAIVFLMVISCCTASYILHLASGSDSLRALAEGLGIAALTIVFSTLTARPMTEFRFFNLLSRRIVGTLTFFGSGSYALYVLHYPLVRWLAYHHSSGYIAVILLAALVGLTPLCEKRLLRLVKSFRLFRFRAVRI